MNNYERAIKKVQCSGLDQQCCCCFGPTGPTGQAGPATITAGVTVTTAPGTQAEVTNVGTNENAVLRFSIPAGATGATGPTHPV